MRSFEDYALPPRQLPPAGGELPAEVLDIRIQAERDVAKMRIEAEREINAERRRLDDERVSAQIEGLRSELAIVRTSRARDDDDDDREPGPWDWVGPLFEKLRPTLEQVIPPLLSKLGQALK